MALKYDVIGKINFGSEVNDILKLNGIKDIEGFKNPSEDNIEDLDCLDNIEAASRIIIDRIENKKTIGILVDCDADGYTSASVIYDYITRISNETNIPKVFIHNGKQHGLSDKEVFKEIKISNLDLLIVPDAGTGNILECNNLIMSGTAIVILDHHRVDNRMWIDPNTGKETNELIPYTGLIFNNAIIVNNQLSENATDKAMTGVGIVYKCIKYIDEIININIADEYLDLVAVGMIADGCDLTNLQSRYLVLKGIEQLKNKTNRNIFLKELINKQSYSMNNNITITSIAYYICPLINSMIRLGEHEQKYNMFKAMCNSTELIERKLRGKGIVPISISEYVYKDCLQLNKKQKEIVVESSEYIENEVKEYNLDKLPVLVCNANNNIDKNFTGLIAANIAGKYKRPCLLLNQYNSVLSGSARGFDKSQIRDFNSWCKETNLFKSVEGHSNAFGVSIELNNVQKLIDELLTIEYNDELIYHVYNVYDDKTISSELIKRLYKHNNLWNNGIDEPLFCVKDIIANINNIKLKGKNNNVISFNYRNIIITYISKHSLLEEYNKLKQCGDNLSFTLICKFSYDSYNDKYQLLVEDWDYEVCNDSVKVNPFGGF